MMTMHTRSQLVEYLTRDSILKLLSDSELAWVSAREGGPALADGDEYVDLQHLHQGVLRVHAATRITIGEVLPRSAIAEKTWQQVCARLAAGNRAR
jgi:hypothetical protein